MPALHTFKKQTFQTTVPYHIILKQHASKRPDTKSFPRFPFGVPFPHQIWCIFCTCVTCESCGFQPAFQSWELDAIGTASGQAWSYFTVSRHLSVKKGCDDAVLPTGPFPCFLFFLVVRNEHGWSKPRILHEETSTSAILQLISIAWEI